MSEHRIAMVGTPCEIMAASKLQYYTDSPIDVKLGLFCMENFSYRYFENLLKEYDLKMDDIEKFQIEKGFVFLLLKTKETVKIPLSVAKRIIRKNCNICVELTSETSDISIGSIGSQDGWSTLIVRTKKGEEIINGAIKQEFIEAKDLTESQFKLLNKIAESKINKNLETKGIFGSACAVSANKIRRVNQQGHFRVQFPGFEIQCHRCWGMCSLRSMRICMSG